jgi:hypothetical protein
VFLRWLCWRQNKTDFIIADFPLVLLLNRKNGEIRETNEDCTPKVFQRQFASLGLNPQGQKYSETPSVAGLQDLQIAQV